MCIPVILLSRAACRHLAVGHKKFIEGGVMLAAPPLSSSGFSVGDPAWSLNAADNLQCREFQTTVFQLASYDVS